MTASIVIVWIVLGLLALVLLCIFGFVFYAVVVYARGVEALSAERDDHWAGYIPERAPGASLTHPAEDVQ